MVGNMSSRPDPYKLGYRAGIEAAGSWKSLTGEEYIPHHDELVFRLMDMPVGYVIGFYEGMNDFRRKGAGQSKTESFIEACVNTGVGLCITGIAYPIINYCTGVSMNISQVLLSTLFFTIISVARGYILRRFFNNLKGVKLFFTKLLTKKKCSNI
jgi:hypothetical protein